MIIQRDDAQHIHIRLDFWREVLVTARSAGWGSTSARWRKANALGGTLTATDAMALANLLAASSQRFFFLAKFLAAGRRTRVLLYL